MTFLRCDPNNPSNRFNRVLDGVGHRGSSFQDLDCVIHNMKGNRFLFIEWKHQGELKDGRLNLGQQRTMEGLAKLPKCAAMLVVMRDDGLFDLSFAPMWENVRREVTEEQLRGGINDWWNWTPRA